jgi:selenide,water dikinase
LAVVLTVDFFPPVLDDPYAYGAAAAANALSDAFAMGAQPFSVLNTLMCPTDLDRDVLGEIMKGGVEKVHEAEAVVAGGHSVDQDTISYGFAVTAMVHPDEVVKNDGAKVGDALILTKPLGIGLFTTAVKKNILSDEHATRVAEVMCRLNMNAGRAMVAAGTHACTDITGFGLAGHARNVAAASGVTLELEASKLPAMEGWEHYHGKGCMSGGSKRNKAAAEEYLQTDGVDELLVDLVVDAQTSGGLLIAIAADKADALVEDIRGTGDPDTAIVGRVTEQAGHNLVRLVP